MMNERVRNEFRERLSALRQEGRGEGADQELDEIIRWLTGYTGVGLAKQIEKRTTFRDFYEKARSGTRTPTSSPAPSAASASKNIEDPLIQKLRYLDKLVDELAKGKKMEKILRKAE
jgi:hypothetical protein